MEINWFTVIAQVVNFLILVWLLKRFLYKPILNAIEEREKKIAAQLQDAASQKTEAQKQRDVFEQKNKSFNEERAAKMDQVHEEINAEKQLLFDGVRQESNALRVKYEDSLKQEQRNLVSALRRKTKEEVFAIAGKTLSDLADAELEEQVAKVFMAKIRTLEGEEKTTFKNAFDNNDKAVVVKSFFKLSGASKTGLEKAVEELTGRKGAFRYLQEPELVSGIEMDTGSYQLSWNIESYLDSLQKNETTKENENAGF